MPFGQQATLLNICQLHSSCVPYTQYLVIDRPQTRVNKSIFVLSHPENSPLDALRVCCYLFFVTFLSLDISRMLVQIVWDMEICIISSGTDDYLVRISSLNLVGN